MTDTRKPVTRRTINDCRTVRRRLAVTIGPDDVITFREHGRRKEYTAEIGKVFVQVARWTADAERAAKKAKRKHGGK